MADEAAHRDHVDPDARSAAPNDHTHDTSHARAELAPAKPLPPYIFGTSVWCRSQKNRVQVAADELSGKRQACALMFKSSTIGV